MECLRIPLQSFREKYRLLSKPAEAKKRWEELYEEGGRANERGVVVRDLHHHLLTGSILNIWSYVERFFVELNAKAEAAAALGYTPKKYTVRIARATLGSGTTPTAAVGDSNGSGVTPSKRAARSSAMSPAKSPLGKDRAGLGNPAALSLVGIWIPPERIDEVLAMLHAAQTARALAAEKETGAPDRI